MEEINLKKMKFKMCKSKVQVTPVCCLKAYGEVEVELHASNSGVVGELQYILSVRAKCKPAHIKL